MSIFGKSAGTYKLNMFRFPWETTNKKVKATSLPPIRAVYFTGSRYICNPPVMNTDDDRIVLVDEYPCHEFMKEKGWEYCGNEEEYCGKSNEHNRFEAWRHGEKNLIFTCHKAYYLQFVAATLLAKELNLRTKDDRIKLFSAVTDDGCYYSGPLPDKGML